MAKVETVRVKADNEGGFLVINKADLTDKHTLFVDKKPTKGKEEKKWSKSGK